MAEHKGGKKNRKYGRNKKGASNTQQKNRSMANKARKIRRAEHIARQDALRIKRRQEAKKPARGAARASKRG